MKIHEEITQEIDDAPRGAGTVAFFDLDGTILFGFSIASIFRERVMSGDLAPQDVFQQFVSLLGHQVNGTEFPLLLDEAAASLAGVEEKQFIELGERVFDKHLAGDIYPESRSLIRAHLNRGHTVVIVSSATRYQIDPIARELNIDHVFCNRCRSP